MPTRVGTRNVAFDLSKEQAADLQWLVENGRRWSSRSALARIEHCREVMHQLAPSMLSAIQAAGFTSNPAEKWSQEDVIVEVDASSDAAPWELLDFGAGPIGLTCRSVSRESIGKSGESENVAVCSSLRVLLVTARPYGIADVPYLAVSKHVRRLLLHAREALHVVVLRPPTLEALTEALKQTIPFDVLHFDGHGDLRPEGPILVFEDSAGRPSNIPASEFVSLAQKSRLKLIVLNACRSAQAQMIGASRAGDLIFRSSLASSLASQAGIPVVAMRYAVQADVAGRFVDTFYRALVNGSSAAAAVQAGRRDLAAPILTRDLSARPDGYGEWLLPVDYTGGPEQILVRLQAPPSPKVTTDSVLPIHGMDAAFLALEKAFEAMRIPVVCGPIGAGKLNLAYAYAEWFQLTTGTPPDIQEIVLDISDQKQMASWNEETILGSDKDRRPILIFRVEAPERRSDTSGEWLRQLSNALAQVTCRSIIVYDGFPHFPTIHNIAVVNMVEVSEDALVSYALEKRPDLEPTDLEDLIKSAVGNPMYVWNRVAGQDPASTRWYRAAAKAYATSGISEGLLTCMRQFDRFVNIYSLRRMMHVTGRLKDPAESFLLDDKDEQSEERKSLETLVRTGLLVRFTPNTYVISPWVQEVWSRLPVLETSDTLTKAFADAVAESCAEYQMDYFSRGLRDAAYVVAREGANISRAWSISESHGDLANLVKLLAGLATLWTLQQRFDLIEERAQYLDQQLAHVTAAGSLRESVLFIRLQAAHVLGRVGNLAEAVKAVAEHRRREWQEAGEPRNVLPEALHPTYFNMLISQQNWAAVLRITGPRDLHRSVCIELIKECGKAEYANGVIKALQSLAKALGPHPMPQDARELTDLLITNYPLIQKGDGVLQSEVPLRHCRAEPRCSPRSAEQP